MYNESKKWFSQTLFYYEDRVYQTEGKLRIAISTNSSDDRNFNPPVFNISISHNFQKSCNLNIHQATDLVTAFKQVLAQAETNDAEVLRKITPNLEMNIKFKLDQNNYPVVEMLLISSSTDFTKIIMPVDVFSVVAHRLKNFVNNYDELCYQLLMKNIDGEYREILMQLPGLIKGISSQIITSEIPDSGAAISEPVETASADHSINELDKFLGSDMENVTVPEIDNNKVSDDKTFNEVQSDFVEKFIEKDLSNLENMLSNIDSVKNPVMDLNHNLIQIIGKDLNYLPSLEGDQLKSISYVSKLLCSVLTQAHIKFGARIPAATPILKYKVNSTDLKDENYELSYDLFLFIAYMRNLRNRLSDKVVDFIGNKSRMYLQMRCYLDPFCFTFLEKSDKKQLRSIISNRFRYYDSIGLFNKYKELLVKYNCPQITEVDVDSFVCEISEKMIGKSNFITDEHDSLVKMNNFRIGSSNNFTLEQIINEVIPLEVDEKLGVEIKEGTASSEVINYFSKKNEPKVTKKNTTEKRSNLVRFANHYRNEVPEQYREDFLKSLEKWGEENYEFDACPWPLAEFGSNIIKGLYIWKPKEDPKLAKNYKYFFSQFEECMLEKDHILVVSVKEEQSSEWTGAFDDMSFE